MKKNLEHLYKDLDQAESNYIPAEERIWNKIETQLDAEQKPAFNYWKPLALVASVAVIIIATTFVVNDFSPSGNAETQMAKSSGTSDPNTPENTSHETFATAELEAEEENVKQQIEEYKKDINDRETFAYQEVSKAPLKEKATFDLPIQNEGIFDDYEDNSIEELSSQVYREKDANLDVFTQNNQKLAKKEAKRKAVSTSNQKILRQDAIRYGQADMQRMGNMHIPETETSELILSAPSNDKNRDTFYVNDEMVSAEEVQAISADEVAGVAYFSDDVALEKGYQLQTTSFKNTFVDGIKTNVVSSISPENVLYTTTSKDTLQVFTIEKADAKTLEQKLKVLQQKSTQDMTNKELRNHKKKIKLIEKQLKKK